MESTSLQTAAGDQGALGPIGDMLQVLPVSGQSVYDQLMEKINPELTSMQLPLLPEKYKNETPAERSARGAKYINDFAEYDKQFALFTTGLQTQVVHFHHEAMISTENQDRAEESSELSSIEDAIASS